MPSLRRLLCISVIATCFATCLAQTCTRISQCKCMMSDGSGSIDLNSIASTTGDPRWTLDGGSVPWLFSYNPCIGFSSSKFTNLAVLQTTKNEGSDEQYNLGVQSEEGFVTNFDASVSITYNSHDGVRLTNIALVCTPGTTEHNLEFLGELITLEYEFVLSSPCACPGVCNQNGVIPPTTTTTATTTTTDDNSDGSNSAQQGGSTSSYWEQVGADLVSLIFHDLILVVIIAIVLIILKLLFNYHFVCCSPARHADSLHKIESSA